MRLIDANVLLYAVDSSSPAHEPARRWLEEALSGREAVTFAWTTLLAFLRITTLPRLLAEPLTVEEASTHVSSWLGQPNVSVVEPGERHWSLLCGLLSQSQARGNLVPDAHLAALAIEHGAVLCTTDHDFARFPGLRWLNPLQGERPRRP